MICWGSNNKNLFLIRLRFLRHIASLRFFLHGKFWYRFFKVKEGFHGKGIFKLDWENDPCFCFSEIILNESGFESQYSGSKKISGSKFYDFYNCFFFKKMKCPRNSLDLRNIKRKDWGLNKKEEQIFEGIIVFFMKKSLFCLISLCQKKIKIIFLKKNGLNGKNVLTRAFHEISPRGFKTPKL